MEKAVPYSCLLKQTEIYRFLTSEQVKALIDEYASKPRCTIELESEYHPDESPDGESVNWSYVWIAKISYKIDD